MLPGVASTTNIIASGFGVGTAGDIPVGSPVEFTLVARDARGNNAVSGGLLFFIYVRSANGASILRASTILVMRPQ